MGFSHRALSRRDLLKFGGVAAAGMAGASVLAGCSPSQSAGATSAPAADTAAVAGSNVPSFLAKPEPITEFAETKDYEIVVVGAGVSGMSAVLTAAKAGARVACLQKEPTPSSQGNMGAGLDLEKTSPAGRAALVSFLIELSDHRADRSLIEAWADNSAAALSQFEEAARAGGVEVNADEPDADRVLAINGYEVYLHANTYFGIGHDEVVKAVAPIAEQAGAEFFYSTPAVQLVTDDSGKVTGVVGEGSKGEYILFNALKGVILATGDYQCDRDMVDFYCPDMSDFPALQLNRTGDGHKMGVWAGGEIEPIGHTKMVHDARVSRADAPFMLVDSDGKRLLCEGPLQGYLNNYVRGHIRKAGDPLAGTLYSVVDAQWQEQAAEWQKDDPAINVRTCSVYYEGDTIADAVAAAAKDGYVLDADAVQASVDRYNELCEKGSDDDFGKDPKFMCAITEPPFAIIPHDFGYGLSAILGGLLVDADNHVLKTEDRTPIEGLYAVGNVSGCFYGGSDYPMDVLGLSIGRAITSGYLAAKTVSSLQ